MTMLIRGGCLCDMVQYEIPGGLSDVAYCHCSICRRALGAAFGAFARVKDHDAQWVTGEKLVAVFESSPGVRRCFCGQCGSTLGVVNETNALDWVALGTVEGDPKVRAEAHIFVGSKAPWHEIADQLPRFETWPQADSEFFNRFD